MPRHLALLCATLLLSACAGLTTNVPEGHKGPVAVVRDSYSTRSQGSANIFYLASIDGQRIRDSALATRQASEGRGAMLITNIIERLVLPQPGVFHIVARTQYAAPIQAMFGKVYEIEGDVKFTPEAGKRYIVRGRLVEGYNGVWVEDEATGAVIGEKIELNTAPAGQGAAAK